MKKILVATDFTEYSDYAMISAASLANQTGAELIILHVINRPLNPDDDVYENYHNLPGGKTIISNIKKKLDDIIRKHKIVGAKTIYELRYDVFKTILKRSERHKVDLIVMGAYGSSGSEESMIGSNTQRVMLRSNVPVLVIKEKLEDFVINKTVFASEFYGDVYNAFPKIKKVLDIFDTELHLLKVNTPSRFQRTEDSLNLMSIFIKEFNLKRTSKHTYNDSTIEDMCQAP